jgi:hypothetical protein
VTGGEEMATELKLSAEYIPPSLMQTVEWFAPVRSGFTWFYHDVRMVMKSTTNTPPHYIDPLLRPIIRELNNKNIQTLASCQGHFYNEEDLNRIYERLKEDEALIRKEGLLLRNLNTSEVVTFKDPEYRMPEFGKLASELMAFAGVGYFSYLADRGDDLVLLRMTREISRSPNVRMTFAARGNALIANVQVDTDEDNQEQIWAELTTRVLGELASMPKVRPVKRALEPFTTPSAQATELVLVVAVLSFLVSVVVGLYLLKVSTYSMLPETTQQLLLLIAIATEVIGVVRFTRRLRFYSQMKEREEV